MEGIVHEILVWGTKRPPTGRFAPPPVGQSAQIRSIHIINHNFFIFRANYLRFERHVASKVGDTFFGSVFTRENDNKNNYPEFESRMHGNNILQNAIFTENDVCEKLKRLKEDKACGPDGIHPKLLKECADIIAKPLYLIFSKLLESGIVPTDWKLANISPIHKKGSRPLASNYRPVSLTCLASKLMKSIIRDAMVQHLVENDLCTTQQHGFTNGRSCLTNLLETFESWTEDVDKGYSVDVIFWIFKKSLI